MIRKVLTSRAWTPISKLPHGLYSTPSTLNVATSPIPNLSPQGLLSHRPSFGFSDDKNNKKPDAPKD